MAFAVVVLLGAIATCCSRTPPRSSGVEYVFPAGFRGLARIVINAPDGAELKLKDGTYTILVRPEGEARIKSGDKAIFGWHIVRARFDDGTAIPLGDERTPSSHVAFWQSGDVGEPWIAVYVGTADEWREAGNKITDQLLGKPPEPASK